MLQNTMSQEFVLPNNLDLFVDVVFNKPLPKAFEGPGPHKFENIVMVCIMNHVSAKVRNARGCVYHISERGTVVRAPIQASLPEQMPSFVEALAQVRDTWGQDHVDHALSVLYWCEAT